MLSDSVCLLSGLFNPITVNIIIVTQYFRFILIYTDLIPEICFIPVYLHLLPIFCAITIVCVCDYDTNY